MEKPAVFRYLGFGRKILGFEEESLKVGYPGRCKTRKEGEIIL